MTEMSPGLHAKGHPPIIMQSPCLDWCMMLSVRAWGLYNNDFIIPSLALTSFLCFWCQIMIHARSLLMIWEVALGHDWCQMCCMYVNFMDVLKLICFFSEIWAFKFFVLKKINCTFAYDKFKAYKFWQAYINMMSQLQAEWLQVLR